MGYGFLILGVNCLLHPEVESDLLFALARVKDVLVNVQITFRHVTRSCGLESGLRRVPLAPAVNGTARHFKVFFYPEAEATVLILGEVVTSTLGAEFVAQPVEHGCEVLPG